MKQSIRFLFIIICVISFIPVSGCSTGDTQEPGTFYGLLELFPAETPLSEGSIRLINYRKTWDDAGISFYKEDGSKMNKEEIWEQLETFISQQSGGVMVFAHGSYYTGGGGFYDSPIQYNTLGYDLLVDVDAEIVQGHVDAINFRRVCMKGKFTLQATQDALKNREEWPEWAAESFKTEQYLDVPVYSWGENDKEHHADSFSPPHIDIWGVARPLAAMDGYMLVGDTVDSVKAMISTIKGETPSLADIPEYALIAEEMDSLDVYFVAISETTKEDDLYNLMVPSQELLITGTAHGRDKRGDYIVIIAVYDSEDQARESEDIQKENLADLLLELGLGKEYIDIHRNGRVLYFKSDIHFK